MLNCFHKSHTYQSNESIQESHMSDIVTEASVMPVTPVTHSLSQP